MPPLEIWISGAWKLKHFTSAVMESLGLRILFSVSRVNSHQRQWESSWHSPTYAGMLGTSFIIKKREKPRLQAPCSATWAHAVTGHTAALQTACFSCWGWPGHGNRELIYSASQLPHPSQLALWGSLPKGSPTVACTGCFRRWHNLRGMCGKGQHLLFYSSYSFMILINS